MNGKSRHDLWRFRLIAVGYLSLLIATRPLWTPQRLFPQVPLVALGGRVPDALEWSLLITLVTSLSLLLVSWPTRCLRGAAVVAVVSSAGLILIDQHRFQPWVWQFSVVLTVLALADYATSWHAWRWVVIGIYGWSAWSKIDYGFVIEHGPFLLDGLGKAVHLKATGEWPPVLRDILAGAIPVMEMTIAVGLAFRRSRRLALLGSILMHVGLLLALGPLGHKHQPGVLLWNLFFIAQNGMLFWENRDQVQCPSSGRAAKEQFKPWAGEQLGNRTAWLVIVLTTLWPSLESFGLCDHWAAWAVYAAKLERVTVFIDEADVQKLPESLRQYLDVQFKSGDQYRLKLDRWSLDAVRVPIYPQDRFQVGVALAVAREFHLDHLRLVIESPANRWTGHRIAHRYFDAKAVETLAGSFRCNAIPRPRP